MSLTESYVKVCSHSSVSSSTIERAIKAVLERFTSLKSTLGCSHTETLSTLRELIVLHMKLKSHSTVLRLLLETTVEIIEKEKHSKILHEAAKTIGSMYSTCGLADQGHEMIQQMRLQIITGSASSEKSSFKLNKSVSKVCYVFLVTFEQTISGDLTASYSETMADLLTETVLYESFTRSISKSNTDVILARAASLRAFLVSRKRKVQIEGLERQAHEIFVKKWGSSLKVGSGISLIFCISLLEELGHHDTHNVKIGHSACISSVAKVESLLKDDKTQQAYEVALCAFNFISQQRAYHDLPNVGYGLKLSTLMADRGIVKHLKPGTDPKLRSDMMELSRRIIREVLQACKDSKIDFVRLQLRELNELAGLLGEQQNHIDLEVSSSNSGLYHHHHTHTTSNSGSSNCSGLPAKSKRIGHPPQSSPSVSYTCRQHMPTRIIAPAPSDSAKTFATTSAASGAPSIPRHSRCLSYFRNSTQAWAITVRQWACMSIF